MVKPVVSSQSDSVIDAAFVDLVERLTQQLQSGQTVNVEELARDHPQHVPRLRQLLPAIQATAKLGLALAVSSAPETEPINSDVDPKNLGDFRIIRERLK